MPEPITVTWGDGFLRIVPHVPDVLCQALRYWHKKLEFDPAVMRRVVTGEYRNLYETGFMLDDQQRPSQYMLTFPGFLHKIREILDQAQYRYQVVDERTPFPAPDLDSALMLLRPYQLECGYTAIMSGGGMIACPTGWGKTWIMGSIIKAYSHDDLCARNTPLAVVTAAEKDIARQDYLALSEILEDREVGLIMSGTSRPSDDVQVITVDSLHKLDPKEIGLVIADEVHTSATPTRTEKLIAARKAKFWGMSATPTGRFDGGDLLSEGLFGPVVYNRTYQQGVDDGALVPIIVYWVQVPEPHIGLERYANYSTRQGKYNWGVEKNRNQNRLIADIVRRTPDRIQLLCIMQHLLQMNNLKELLPEIEIVHAATSEDTLIKGRHYNLTPVSNKERREIYDRMTSGRLHKVLSTYVYKQGVNFPQLRVLVCAGGGGSEIAAGQIPGRTSRNIAGKDAAYLVDFWHRWDTRRKDGKLIYGPILKDDRARDKVYENLGFERHWVESIDELPFLEEAS